MKTKILIVDDLKENIIALAKLIEENDVEIYTADTPDKALNLILDHDFGLALVDVQMPMMTGFEMARLVRGVERSRTLPIIFVTAQASESSLIFEGYESGAVDLLFKPLDPHIVRSKVRVFVRLDQQNHQLEAQVSMMARLKQEAEAANVAKSRFLANMSHEIRTPLSAVLGFADVLSQTDLSAEDRRDSLASISRNGKLLLRIIDDILDLSRIEAQKLELEKTPFDLSEVLADLESTLSNKAVDKGISLVFNAPDFSDKHFVSDPLRIKQVLLNVIGNAIKFTHRGEVRVVCECKRTGPDSKYFSLKFTVQDTGIGLTREEAVRLFEPFAQADTSTRRRFGGTGLGLAIAKQLARSLGGDVQLIRSEPNVGSTFEVSMRVLETDEGSVVPSRYGHSTPEKRRNAQRSRSEIELEGKRILVVDDVADNRTLIERYLRPSGIEVGLASGGREALDQAKQAEWDAVLMDIQMPNMDGYEATAKLRELGFKKPIIALTAHAMREELERCLRAGCDMTLTKPVAKGELLNRLAEVLVEAN